MPVGFDLLTLTRLEVIERELEESSTDSIGVSGSRGGAAFFLLCIEVVLQ